MCYARILILVIFSSLVSACSLFRPITPDKYFYYTVQKGDTVYELGLRFHVSMDDIIGFNDIDDVRKLQVGQLLKIPGISKGAKGVGKQPAIPPGIKSDASSAKTVKLTEARKYIGKLLWPVPAGKLNSRFGRRWLSFHEGIDITASQGSEIIAAHDGEVVHSGSSISGYGNMIVIKGNGFLTVFGHNKTNHVDVGDRVRRGDLIAEVGATGRASGPHLHFETRVYVEGNGYTAVDPLVFYR